MTSNLNLIVIDSNFILLPFQFKLDYFDEIKMKLEGELRFIVFKQVLDELEAKRKRESQATKFIRLLDSGLSYIEKNKDNTIIEFFDEIKNDNESTDDFLLRKSLELRQKGNSIFLATNDSELRKRARELGLSTIYLRQQKYLSIDST